MKVAIIGADTSKQTLIEALVKAVEEQTGETIEFVNIHSKEADFLTQKVHIKEVEPYIMETFERFTPPPETKRKGHERPYKYHR